MLGRLELLFLSRVLTGPKKPDHICSAVTDECLALTYDAGSRQAGRVNTFVLFGRIREIGEVKQFIFEK